MNTESQHPTSDMTAVDTASGGLFAATKPRHPMETLLKTTTAAINLKPGDVVEGVVIEKRGARLFVNIGPALTGIVYGQEYYAAQDIIKTLTKGDPISAKIVELDNDDGYVELSLREAGRARRWVDIRRMMQEGSVLELPVQKANTGGLIFEVSGVEGFLPTSQLSFKNYPRVDGGDKEKIFQELQKFVGTVLRVKILDINPDDNKLIFTEKGIDTTRVREALGKYAIGDIVEGEITSVVDFGAFMKFDEQGLEGLIHLSEIDWTLIENPREVLTPHDRVRAKIIDIQGEKISLSLKQLKEDPWQKAAAAYQKGDIITGKVTKFNPFGAFIAVGSDIQGLVHISEFGTEQNMKDALTLGRDYPFTILFIDTKEHRMSLGLKKEEKELKEKAESEVAA